MIKKYIIERRSWILLFIFLLAFILFIAFIDPMIPFTSIAYIVFLSLIIFLFFFIIRYHKETKYYKNIEAWDDIYDISHIEHVDRPFEKIIQECMTKQAAQYKADLANYRTNLEQEKDELLSWIHEVKTPLTTMHLMIERLNDESLKSQLMTEWLRIDLLLDQQLHQKRIPFIENDLHIEKTELQSLIHHEIKALKSWCFQKGIGFDLSLEVTDVLTDKKWLGFIIRQLLTNAIKYSENSDILINSYIKDGQTKLEIKDFGRGINPKDLPRIFDKGFTSTTKHRDQAATGMGLYLVKKITQPLLIQIDVQTKIKEGTTFVLTFPKKNEFVHITSM